MIQLTKGNIMNTHEHTILTSLGKPTFVVLPYEDYLVLMNRKNSRIPVDETIPHEVIKLQVENNWSMIRAWREYLGITQVEMAERLEVRQPTYANMESLDARPRKATIDRIADALGISTQQLV
ncbi:Helix-turn-helix [Oligella urethralis]|nr:Helix-turn-helix [Oligella urethralis]